MEKAVDGQRTGLRWTPFQQLEDLDFADDLTLLSGSHTQMQSKTNRLHNYSKQLGLMINNSKTKVMRINTKSHHAINIKDQHVESVDECVYLGGNISTDGGADKARHAFRIL